jgi:hypothetical protein
MKIDSIALPAVQNTQASAPIMTVDDIKSILYLGIKGDMKLDTGKKHTVDTYA